LGQNLTKLGKWLSAMLASVLSIQLLLPYAPASAAELSVESTVLIEPIESIESIESTGLYKEVRAGDESVTVLDRNNAVWVWGVNPLNSYDSNYTTFAPAPLRKADGSQLTGVIDIASGAYHSLALAGDGTVWAWGRNSNGQLGNGTTTDSHVPVPVELTDVVGNVVKVEAGNLFSVVLTDAGFVYA
jgi:alpha-tubulin suppressor-like RCC1 family protein